MRALFLAMTICVAGAARAEAPPARSRVPKCPGPQGIEQLHIPAPPNPMRESRQGEPATRNEWLVSLAPEQRMFVRRFCAQRCSAKTEFCGYINTPLVAAFERQRVAFTGPGTFAFTPGLPVRSTFPSTETPWLARDLNGNGLVDDGSELLGSDTALPDGATARDGFEALRALDSNGDGVVDGKDPAFASLLLWADANGDRRCTRDELKRLDSVVLSLDVWPAHVARCDDRGNCEGLEAGMRWRGADGKVRIGTAVDVFLAFSELELARR